MDKYLQNESDDTLAYITSLDLYLKAVELAQLKGKKPGDSIESELREVMRANPKNVTEIKNNKDLKNKLKK